jgi:hypothetical protein
MRAEPTGKLAVSWVSWHIGINPGTGLSNVSYDVSAVKKTLPLPTLHRFVYSTYCFFGDIRRVQLSDLPVT